MHPTNARRRGRRPLTWLARVEVLFAERTWGGTSVVATPYIAATVHF